MALGLGLLYLAFRGVDTDNLIEDLKNAKYLYVVISVILGYLAYIVRAYRWILLIEPLNYKPRLKNVYHAVVLGYFANFAFPRIGEVARCGVLSKSDKIPMDSLIGTVIIERTIDFLTLITLVIVLFVAKFSVFGDFITKNIFRPIYKKAFQFVDFPVIYWILIAGIFLILIILFFRFRKKAGKLGLFIKLKRILQGLLTGIKTIVRLRSRRKFILSTILIWILYYFMTYILVFSIEATQHLKLIDGLFLLVIGGIGMSLPVQGGIGAFHWIISKGMGIYGISKTEGLVFATLAHEAQAIFLIIVGLISLFIFYFSLNKKRFENNSETKR